MDTTTVYAADIVKSYRNATGDLVVEGVATSPDLDLDQQVCDPDWLKSAMPDWFEWGNIRAQHSDIPAGHAVDMENQAGDRWWIKAVITNPEAAHMAETGTYKGFSIGINSPQIFKDARAQQMGATRGRIAGGRIVHVGLVDRPCNPVATMSLAKEAKPGMTVKASELDSQRMLVRVEEMLTLEAAKDPSADVVKRDVSTGERDRLAGTGAAMPDGSYPIANAADLRNAIRAIGRAKNPGAVKSHIKRRAKALGKENLVPDEWKTPAADAVKDDAPHDPAMVTSVRDGLIALLKAELDELESGEDELCDVSELLCALKMFMCWWSDEAVEGEVAAPYTGAPTGSVEQVMLTVNADGTTTKAVSQTPPPVPTDVAAGGGDRLTELVKTAIAEANQVSEGRIKALEAELAKVLALPAPGGPVLTRTSQDTAKAARHDALLTKATEFRQLAYQIDDPTARQGYLERAEQFRTEAAALKG